MERLTEASPNGVLIAVGNVMSGGPQPIERLDPRQRATRRTTNGFADAL